MATASRATGRDSEYRAASMTILGIAGEDSGTLVRRRLARDQVGGARVRGDRGIDLALCPERAAKALVEQARTIRVDGRIDEPQ